MKKKNKHKHWYLTMLFFSLAMHVIAYNPVKLTISDGIYNAKMKSKMENTVSLLLTEVNRAQEHNTGLTFTSPAIQKTAIDAINQLWYNEHFFCPDKEVVCHCLTLKDGYQVRGIPIIVVHEGEEAGYQEVVIIFDKNGDVINFLYTINPEIYSRLTQVVTSNKRREVVEIRERMEILKYVEQFRTAYNQKDLAFLRQVFSDDALIITGHVVKVQKTEITPNGVRVVYKKQSKKEYLNNLANTFRNSRYIKVDFDNITIAPHPTKDRVYGVTVHQSWKSGNYHDEGYVFMLWDFRKKNPQIHVRTWQPEELEPGRKLNPNEVFTLGDFDL